MDVISSLKKYLKPDILLIKTSLIDSVQLSNIKLIRSTTILTLITLLSLLIVSLVKCAISHYVDLFWVCLVQFIVTLFVTIASFRNYKRYMGYIATYGVLFFTLASEIQDSHNVLYIIEQRVLFTNSILLILIFVSSLIINPRHSLYIGLGSLLRIATIECFHPMVFIHRTMAFQLILTASVSVCIFLAFKKLYRSAYQSIINESIIRQKNDQMKQLIGFKQDMISTILHDIRNPLNNILSATNETLNAQQIAESVHHALQIADNFIDVHRMEEGAIILQPSYKSVYQTALLAVGQVNYLMEEKNNKIQLNIAESLRLNIDHQLIERVIVNLLTNSIKHSLPNSLIVFNCDFFENHVRFEFKNNGKPIHPDDLNSVFDKFFSKEDATETSYKSKGLGLWFCKMVINAHGGEIGLSSNYPKNGTSTWFTLPHLTTSGPELPVNKKLINVKIQLNELEKVQIRKYAAEICNYEIYETGSILKVLNKIVMPDSPNVEKWKDLLINAAVDNNKAYFDELMALLD